LVVSDRFRAVVCSYGVQISRKNGQNLAGMLIARDTRCSHMKPPETNPHFSPNWTWPQKTWFRERLNAVKAQELEANRKRANSQNSLAQDGTPTPDEPAEQGKP
jgi:hypothetical protein